MVCVNAQRRKPAAIAEARAPKSAALPGTSAGRVCQHQRPNASRNSRVLLQLLVVARHIIERVTKLIFGVLHYSGCHRVFVRAIYALR